MTTEAVFVCPDADECNRQRSRACCHDRLHVLRNDCSNRCAVYGGDHVSLRCVVPGVVVVKEEVPCDDD